MKLVAGKLVTLPLRKLLIPQHGQDTVADDETDLEFLIKQKFRRQIREQKYQFVFALNANEALQKLEQHPDVEVVH